MSEFAKAIVNAIEERGISITELAEKSHVTRQHLYRIMAGEHAPSLAVAERIASVLDLQLTVSQKSSKQG